MGDLGSLKLNLDIKNDKKKWHNYTDSTWCPGNVPRMIQNADSVNN